MNAGISFEFDFKQNDGLCVYAIKLDAITWTKFYR